MKLRNIAITSAFVAALCLGIFGSNEAIKWARITQHNSARAVEYAAFAENICASASGTVFSTVLSAQTQTYPSSPNASGDQAPQPKHAVPVESAEYVVASCRTKSGLKYALLHFRGTDVCEPDGWHVKCTPIETLDGQWRFTIVNKVADRIDDIGEIETDRPKQVELFTAREAYDNLTATLREAEKDASMRTTYWLPIVPDPDVVGFSHTDLAKRPDPSDENDRLVADDALYHQVVADENLLQRTVYRSCLDRPSEKVLRYVAQDVDQNNQTTTFKVSCGNM